jgi:two-component system chemotaxis sensor kinase CheA
MSLRMVPIRSTFQKMTRLVRDLGANEGKQVQLLMAGEDTELDRTIVEEISDPLVHMIRNSVDHGIERPEIRLERGKPALGTIHLRACHEGGNIVIEIRDDGGGLNKERIFAKAVSQGLISADAQLPDSEIYNLIFLPGFSTAEKVTSISGRGVGMDVVRRNIERLRGRVAIESELGHGSKFTIYLPLTLAIIDGLIVSVGGRRYILPTLSVRESFRPTQQMLSTFNERGNMVMVRGHLIPMLTLGEYFGDPSAETDPTKAIAIVVESNGGSRCLVVDQLLGKQEVVIKSLGETFKNAQALAGAAILGDGRVGLILDVDSLVRLESAPVALAA